MLESRKGPRLERLHAKFLQKQKREPGNEVDKGLELKTVSQLDFAMISFLTNQSTSGTVCNFSIFISTVVTRFTLFRVCFVCPHCLVFVFLYLILSNSTQNVSKRYLLFHKVLRRYRRIRIQVRAVRCLYN